MPRIRRLTFFCLLIISFTVFGNFLFEVEVPQSLILIYCVFNANIYNFFFSFLNISSLRLCLKLNDFFLRLHQKVF